MKGEVVVAKMRVSKQKPELAAASAIAVPYVSPEKPTRVICLLSGRMLTDVDVAMEVRRENLETSIGRNTCRHSCGNKCIKHEGIH